MQTTTKETTKQVSGGGWIKELSIVRRFQSMSKFGKIFLTTYLTLATASFGIFTYNDGKFALLHARVNSPAELSKEEEWAIVKQGCERDILCNI